MYDIQSIKDIQTLILTGFKDWDKLGDVSVKQDGQLLLFNYTAAAQYNRRWNFFEIVSRGLIIEAHTGEVIARPFDKFFNWFENGRRASGHIVTITEKMDGSLGILYRVGHDYRIATRGSFNSEQAQWATEYLQNHYDLSGLDDQYTLLFEIIYPSNRVVVNYGQREDLVLLAARNRFTGDYLPFFPSIINLASQHGFSLPQTYKFNDLTKILEVCGELDENHEGFVIEFSDGSRFKFKGDRYIELHRLITSLSFKNTLRAVQSGDVNKMLEDIPDEYMGQVRTWLNTINDTVDQLSGQVEDAYASAPKEDRKTFALWAQKHHRDIAPYLFAKHDGKPLKDIILKKTDWKSIDEVAYNSDPT